MALHLMKGVGDEKCPSAYVEKNVRNALMQPQIFIHRLPQKLSSNRLIYTELEWYGKIADMVTTKARKKDNYGHDIWFAIVKFENDEDNND